MTQNNFLNQLEEVYALLETRDSHLARLYTPQSDEDKKIIQTLINIAGLEENEESMLASATRIIALKEDGLVQLLKRAQKDEQEIEKISSKVFSYVADFHIQRHKEFLEILEQKNLLTPFYRTLLNGVHAVGVAITQWQPKWTEKIIYDQNKVLRDLLGSNEAIHHFLEKKDLLEFGEDGLIADRSYSILQKTDQSKNLEKIAYAKGFPQEVAQVETALDTLLKSLLPLHDETFNQKQQWLKYFQAIKEAFTEENTDHLIKRWADVDRAWMEVTTPIQVGHPLEYYEDHYRKAVALEWDVRIINPKRQGGNTTGESLKKTFDYLFNRLAPDEIAHMEDVVKDNIDRTQLYIGRPALFYGAEFNGLFSAQVVPNDEHVSKERGKKIFAFADFVHEGQKARPFSLLDREILGEEFLSKEREVLFKNSELWHKLYDIETIGHEYGHILWVDSDTETVMNESGNFKNLEEFKATSGGLVAYFEKNQTELLEEIFVSVIKRAVKLIGWMETGEVEPYYTEGLIHLSGMFESSVLEFDEESKTLNIDLSPGKLNILRMWYISTYRSLAIFYMEKKDALEFLHHFVAKEERYFKPHCPGARAFVEYYWERFKTIGQVVDKKSNKEDWV